MEVLGTGKSGYSNKRPGRLNTSRNVWVHVCHLAQWWDGRECLIVLRLTLPDSYTVKTKAWEQG